MRYVLVLLALGLLALPVLADDANSSGNITNMTNVTVGDNSTVNLSDLNLTDTAGLLATCSGNESASVGALPGDFTYGFKRFFENVDKFFTFSPSDAAVKHAKYGHERAVEAHLEACKAHDEEAAGNLTQSNSTIGVIQQLIADQDKEMNDSEADLDAAISQGSANNTTISEVDNYTRNSIAVLQSVYERAPESAKDGLLNALNNSIENFQRHQEKRQQQEQRHGDDGSNVTGNATNGTDGGSGRGRGHGDDSNGSDSTGNWTGHGDDGQGGPMNGTGNPSGANWTGPHGQGDDGSHGRGY